MVDDGVIRISYRRARVDAGELVYSASLLHRGAVRMIALGKDVYSIWLEGIGRILGAKPSNGQAQLPEGVGGHDRDVSCPSTIEGLGVDLESSMHTSVVQWLAGIL